MSAKKMEYRPIQKSDALYLQQAEDLGKILDLAQLRHAPKTAPESTGFLISGNDREKFEKLIAAGAMLIGAFDSERLVGYILASDGGTFHARHADTQFGWTSASEKIISEFENGAFTYVDQIAVNPKYHGSGIADDLLAELARHCRSRKFFLAFVLRSPVHNARSEAFFKKNGYEVLGEASTPQIQQVKDVRSVILVKYSGDKPKS